MEKKVNDNFYRKGQFVVNFIVSCPTDKDVSKDVVLRSVGAFLFDLRENTRLKVSEYFDIEEITDSSNQNITSNTAPCYKIDFIIYNKLGITNLRNLIKYFKNRNESTSLRVVDPQTGIRVRFYKFIIRFYFIDFILNKEGKTTWKTLQDFLSDRNRGYEKLRSIHQQRRGVMHRNAISNPSIVLLTNATKRLQTTNDRDEAVLAINDILDAANDILDDITEARAAVRRPIRRRRLSERRKISQRRWLREEW